MNAAMRNGLVVALIHVALVGSVGAKLLVDRATRPRVWVRSAPVDPNLPIRGRYVRLQIEVESANPALTASADRWSPVALRVEDGRLMAVPAADSRLYVRSQAVEGRSVLLLTQPLAYFIPEHVPDPSRRAAGEELWVEVTVPTRGAPRPIRLGVKKGGVLTPLR